MKLRKNTIIILVFASLLIFSASSCILAYMAGNSTNVYTVTFETNGGTSVAKQLILSGSVATEPDEPTKDYATFDGWYSDSSFENVFDFSTAITANTVVYAKWDETPIISLTYIKMSDEYGSDTAWTTWAENYEYVTTSTSTTSSGYNVTISYNISSMTPNTSTNETEAAAAGSAYYGAFCLAFEDDSDVTVSYSTYTDYALSDFFDEADDDSGYIDWWRLYSETAEYSIDGKSLTYTFKKDGYRDTTLTIIFERSDEFVALEYSAFPMIFSDSSGDSTKSWSTWNSNASNVTVEQENVYNGYAVTVTYDHSSMTSNTSSNETMATKYGSSVWCVTGTTFDDEDGVTVTYSESDYELADFYFGQVEESTSATYSGMWWDWWLLYSPDGEGTDTYDRNGKTTTLTFKKSGCVDTVVTITFTDTAE